MDLFTSKSDLDLSVNFNADFHSQFARKDKISVIRNLAKVLYAHQSNYLHSLGLCNRSKRVNFISIYLWCPFIYVAICVTHQISKI